MNISQEKVENKDDLICAKCNVPMEPGKIHITYIKSTFPAELLVCPICGLVYVPEELALGKMLDVEKMMEEK